MKYLTRESNISTLPLSNRLSNLLHRNQIHTIGKMIDFPVSHNWETVSGMGAKTIEEVNYWIDTLMNESEEYRIVDTTEKEILDSISESPSYDIFESLKGVAVTDMPLSVRAKNCLLTGGITNAFQLAGKTKEQLLHLKNMGQKTANEISEYIKGLIPKSFDERSDEYKADPNLELANEIHGSLGGNCDIYLKEILETKNDYPDAQGETLYYRLYASEFLRNRLKDQILLLLKHSPEGISKKSLAEKMPHHLENTTILEEVLLELEQVYEISIGEVMIEKSHPTILQYLAYMDDFNHKDVLLKRMQGYTLEEIGKEYGVTRERIRQIANKALQWVRSKQSHFYEDKYAYVFSTYYFSFDDFLLAFNEPPATYYYLDAICRNTKANSKQLEASLDDNELSVAMRKQIEKVVYKNYIMIDGIPVLKERQALAYHFVKTCCRELTKYDEFESSFNEYIADLHLSNSTLFLEGRSYENKLNAAEYVLWNHGRSFRYYDIAGNDYSELLETLNLTQYENTEVSSLKFFREYPDVMIQYDIRDEYELHNLLKKIWPAEDTTVIFKKMPTIEIGTPDREEQVLNLLLQYAPISAENLAIKYEELYGIKAATVLANYMKGFDEYYYDGMYTIEANNLPVVEFSKMQELLTSDYYSIPDIKRIYLKAFPNSVPSQINPYTLKTLGFRIYSGYVIKNTYPNATDYFNSMLSTDDIVDTRDIDKSLAYNQAYISETRRLKSMREITEFAPKQYINIRRLGEYGISKNDLEEYCSSVCSFVENGEFFTIESIRSNGFTHSLDNLGFNEWFYASILKEDRKHFALQRIGGTRVIMRGFSETIFDDMLKCLMESFERMDVYDLRDLLESKYGICISREKLIECVRRTDMYYDVIMETVYIDYETYFEEV